MITTYIHDGVLHLVAHGSKDSAEISNWINHPNPQIDYNELWIPAYAEPHEVTPELKLSPLVQHIRQVHDSLVNS